MTSFKPFMSGVIIILFLLGSSLTTTTWADGRYPRGFHIDRDDRPLPARHHLYEHHQKHKKHPRNGSVGHRGAHSHNRHQQHPRYGSKPWAGQRPQIWITLPWLVIR